MRGGGGDWGMIVADEAVSPLTYADRGVLNVLFRTRVMYC